MIVEIHHNNGEILRQYNNIISKRERKKQELINYIKLISISFISIVILFGYIATPQVKADYKDDLGLSDCRLTQDEESHIKKGHGSMYALDIACERGKSFDVYTPQNRDIYLIEKIGYEERLGNFIVLKHGNLRWVYGHTITDKKQGESIKGGKNLGKTNISGMSENYHLHIELWAYRNNIKFSYLENKVRIVNNKSFDLRMQRGIVSDREINEIILDFIDDFEGMHLEAYSDGKTRYSIGFGTKSYKGEVITKQQAQDRARIKIQQIREKYNLGKYNINIQKAVVSYAYNLGSLNKKQIWLLENGYYKALGIDFKQYTKANGKELGGLIKRRMCEYNLLV